MTTLKTTEEFKQELSSKYPDITVLGEYTGASKKIEVSCLNGHRRLIIPTNLLTHGTGSTCRECNKLTTSRLEWNTNNISKLREAVDMDYTTKELMHLFNTTKSVIDNACYKFGISRSKFRTISMKRVMTLLDTLNYKYIGANEVDKKITYTCNNGHIHTQSISNFLAGHHCPKCINALGISKGETSLVEYIKSIYSGWIELKDRTILGDGKELDIVLPDIGIAFEYNGVYYHREEVVGKYYHKYKTDKTLEFGFNLIHIYEDQWILKNDIVKSRINSILGLNDTIYARKCTVKEIEYQRDFLENNHLFGAGSPTSINLGLFYYNELVAIMTFSKPRFNTNYMYELVRYCSILNINIIGGASKLLKYFIKKYGGSIISYSDRSWSTGNLYKKLGFTYSHTSDPGYRYYKKLSSLSRYKCQKHLLKEMFPNTYKDELTETEIMQLEGYSKVYDSGNDVWVLGYP